MITHVAMVPNTPIMLTGASEASDFKLHRGYSTAAVTPSNSVCLDENTPVTPADFASAPRMSFKMIEKVKVVPRGVRKQHIDIIQEELFPTSSSHAALILLIFVLLSTPFNRVNRGIMLNA
mmetsp:Transcript_22249/g.33925  ORF Transcript_22249/g.33925 Transcript_22249/m.33925 type:complete len:121 (-) Transcript_22249:538-900(-)